MRKHYKCLFIASTVNDSFQCLHIFRHVNQKFSLLFSTTSTVLCFSLISYLMILRLSICILLILSQVVFSTPFPEEVTSETNDIITSPIETDSIEWADITR